VSIGFRFAAALTGKNVAKNAVIIEINASNINDFIPKTNNLAPTLVAIALFMTLQIIILAIVAIKMQMETITAVSKRKILKTSVPFAPIARNIPISFCF